LVSFDRYTAAILLNIQTVVPICTEKKRYTLFCPADRFFPADRFCPSVGFARP